MWVQTRCGPRMWDRCFKNWGLPNFIGVAANMVKFGTVKGGQNGGSTVNWANFFEGGKNFYLLIQRKCITPRSHSGLLL